MTRSLETRVSKLGAYLEQANGSNRIFLVWEGNAESLAHAQEHYRPGDQIITVGWLKAPLQTHELATA